jgi:hypothetical protein
LTDVVETLVVDSPAQLLEAELVIGRAVPLDLLEVATEMRVFEAKAKECALDLVEAT